MTEITKPAIKITTIDLLEKQGSQTIYAPSIVPVRLHTMQWQATTQR